MARLSTRDYDELERSVRDGRRLSIVRQGRELVVVPLRLFMREGRETIEVRHPTTGDMLTVRLDDLDEIGFIP
ncbi:MAG TPA: hypothetical protein VF981_11340 [Gemmatimonadaceae bacterium]